MDINNPNGDHHNTTLINGLNKLLNFSGEKPSTPILDTINYPIHMKNLSVEVAIIQINVNF